MTLLLVQQMSRPGTSVVSSGSATWLLEMAVLIAVIVTAALLIRDWRRWHEGEGATLANEAERWLRNQRPG